MEKMTLGEIAVATGGRILSGDENFKITKITTDSRESKEGGLFIAIVGERFDAHNFASDFLTHGGEAVIVERELPGKRVVLVSDTRKALGNLAAHYRAGFNIPMVGITGSVGKTSTKDMIESVLSQKFNALATKGNFNNDIGLPLTLFRLDRSHQVAVVEMGMNHMGEIARLSSIARPDIAVITGVGTAHIGNLGSRASILKAKLEILEGLSPEGIVVLNGDSKLLWGVRGSLPYKTIYYGIKNAGCDVVAYDIVLGAEKSKFKVKFADKAQTVHINVVGEHHIYNALAAIAVGGILKMNTAEIVTGISKFKVGSMRQNIITAGGVKIIEDCYNASLDSMESSLKVLYQVGGKGRKIAVLGDILETGSYAEEIHRKVGKMVAEYNFDMLVTLGGDAKFIAKQAEQGELANVKCFDNNTEALEFLKSYVKSGDTLLFKASRGMKLEEISKGLAESLE